MIHPPCGESCGATARCEAQYEQIGKDEKRTTKKTKKRLQIKTVKENRRRKYYTFKPPSLDDFQNAADNDRYNARSTVITSQLPVAQWHDAIGDPTLADAILEWLA